MEKERREEMDGRIWREPASWLADQRFFLFFFRPLLPLPLCLCFCFRFCCFSCRMQTGRLFCCCCCFPPSGLCGGDGGRRVRFLFLYSPR